MGTLMGRAVSVVVYSLQSAMAACSCSGKMSNGPEAVVEKMSAADNGGLQKAMIIPDIQIEHVSKSCDSGSAAPLLHGSEISFSSNLTPTPTGMMQITNHHKHLRLDLNGAHDNTIELPEKFRNSFVSGKKDKSVLNAMDISCILDRSSCSNKTSTENISQAISWIHQELESMKEQDKVLLRQFLDLRAAIRSLSAEGGRLRTLSYGGRDDKMETLRQQSNGSDVNDVTADDDDVFTSDGTPCNNSSLHEGCKMEFRGRTVSCISPMVKYHAPTRHLTKS